MAAREKTAVTRKNSPPIKVYCLPEERATIEQNARESGLSTGAYLRVIGQGYKVVGIVDNERVVEMARINADLGRLGGLLKMWLANDDRMKPFGEDHIRALLSRIETLSEGMREQMLTVLKKRPVSLAPLLAAKTPERDEDNLAAKTSAVSAEDD